MILSPLVILGEDEDEAEESVSLIYSVTKSSGFSSLLLPSMVRLFFKNIRHKVQFPIRVKQPACKI